MNNSIKKLLRGICCSKCRSEFDAESFNIVRQEDGLTVLQIKCAECEKGFGIALLGLSKEELLNSIDHNASTEDAAAINYDDVIDAHEYIKDLDENWKKFMEKRTCS